MDDADLTLPEIGLPMGPLRRAEAALSAATRLSLPKSGGLAAEAVGAAEGLADHDKVQVAKDFESILLGKLTDQIERTVGDWGFEEEQEGVSGQVRGLFWMYLAREIADNGGFGLWKDVYRFLNGAGAAQTGPQDAVEDK